MQLLDGIPPIPAAVLLSAAVVCLSVVYYLIRQRNILPGPRGLPYFGLFPSLKDETCHLQLENIGRKYGDLYSFTYMGNLIINLGSVKAIREVHVNKSDCFNGRFTEFNMLTYMLADGVAMTNGEPWKVLRKFFIITFKEYGLTAMRDNMVGPIYDSISTTIEELKSQKGDPFNIIDILVVSCTKTVRKVLFGEDGVSNETLLEMNRVYAVALERMTGVNLLYIGPLGKLLFHTLPVHRRALAHHKELKKLCMECAKKIEANMDENHTTCVIGEYFKERNERRRNNDPTWKFFTDEALVSSIAQFTGESILSVAYFIGCFFNVLVKYPEEQDKIYKELMEVVGESRVPVAEDRSKMPYTNAFMNEVIRTSNFFPLFPSLECSKETTVRGYRIPKGAITLLNIWQSHHDPETYQNPDMFNPNRYIPAEGKRRAELPVQFGIGKRACSGEPFVMMQAFLYLTNIVKNFVLQESPNPNANSDYLLMTGYLELCIVPRTDH